MTTTSAAFQTETLADLLETLAREVPESVALWWAGRPMTFEKLEKRANQVAHRFLADAHKTRVAVLGRDNDQSLVILFGAAKACLPVTFVNWRLLPAEVRFILEDCACSHLFVEASQASLVREVLAGLSLDQVTVVTFGGPSNVGISLASWVSACPETAPDIRPVSRDIAVMLYTSGTTGFPKGVQLQHRSLLAIRREQQRAGQDWWGISPQDVALHSLPLFHVGGLWWAVNVLAAGASLVVTSQFEAETALRLIDAHAVTLGCWVPAMLRMLLERHKIMKTAGRSLRRVAYGGAPVEASLLAAIRESFGCRLFQFYGLTETGNTAVCLRDEDHVTEGSRLNAAGLPYPGVELRCVNRTGEDCAVQEVGEVWIRSPANMLGYWNRPEETARTLHEGWVRTGDAGYLDEEGFLYICDRIKDMIIAAGENIYPAEVERAIKAHPAVKDVAVIGVPDDRWGEAVKALIIADESFDTKELLRFLKGKLAEYKFPRSIDLVQELPRTPSGKVKKQELRRPYWSGRDRQVN